ncbi:MAG: transcription antitermination factor NusB [Candidatus Margulisiibacteriota bacterium]
MGKRSTSRRIAMQALYQAETSGVTIEEALEYIFENEKFIEETKQFARHLATSAWEDKDESDRIISRLTIGWPLERLSKVDHSILRLALYEIRSGQTPASVVVDEAVELAKKYSSEEAAKFINGLLGSYLRENQ